MRFRHATAQTTVRCAELRVARCSRCSDRSQRTTRLLAVKATKRFPNGSTAAGMASGCSWPTTHGSGTSSRTRAGCPATDRNMRWIPGRGVGVVALANSTYAPMSMMARRMLEIVDEHGLAPRRTRRAECGVARCSAPTCRAAVGLGRRRGRGTVRRQRRARRFVRQAGASSHRTDRRSRNPDA